MTLPRSRIRPTNPPPEAVHTVEGVGCPEDVIAQGEIVDGKVKNEIVNNCEVVPEGESQEEINRFVCMPCEDPEGADQDVEDEAEVQMPATDPGQPTPREREEHELTHLPFRPWCKAFQGQSEGCA